MHIIDTEPQITRARPADAGTVRELTRLAYAKWVPVIGREPIPMLADYDSAVREHLIDLLMVGDEYVALVEMIENVDHLMIENLAVAPGFQGRGYGRLLAGHAEECATALCYREIRLYTNKAFAENIQLYSHLGYTIDRQEAYKGGVIVHMHKML